MLDSPLPSNEDAERIIIGSIIIKGTLFEDVSSILTSEHFYNPMFRSMYRAFEILSVSHEKFEPLVVSETMRTNGLVYNPYSQVSDIMTTTLGLPFLNTPEIIQYATVVKNAALSRRAVLFCVRMARDLSDGRSEKDVPLILAEAESLLKNIADGASAKGDEGFTPVSDIVPIVKQQFEDYHAGISTGVQTGMRELDDILDGGGLQGKAVYLVAAGEKLGKTSLVLDWSYNIAAVQHKQALIVTMEMSQETMTKRLFSTHSGISYSLFRPGFQDTYTNEQAYTRAMQELEKFAKLPIKIADRIHTLAQMRRHITRAVEDGRRPGRQEVGAVFIDYLQLVKTEGDGFNREQEVSKISREIKLMASDLDIPIVAISNLNRKNLTEGQEPDTFNLRDSGSLAFDAEAVMFLHNPRYIPGKPYEAGEIQDINLIVARQRNGPTARIPLKFIGKYMQYLTESQYNSRFGSSNKPTVTQASWEDDSLWQ